MFFRLVLKLLHIQNDTYETNTGSTNFYNTIYTGYICVNTLFAAVNSNSCDPVRERDLQNPMTDNPFWITAEELQAASRVRLDLYGHMFPKTSINLANWPACCVYWCVISQQIAGSRYNMTNEDNGGTADWIYRVHVTVWLMKYVCTCIIPTWRCC